MTLADAQGAVDTLSQSLGGYAALLVAVGSLSMAFLEMLKGVFNLRRWFHQGQILAWLVPGYMPLQPRYWGLPRRLGRSDTPEHERAARELLQLAIGGARYSKALFEQPVEKMFGQIQAAANIALEFPDRYPSLFGFLVTQDSRPAEATEHSDDQLWFRFASGLSAGKAISVDGQDARAANQARVRLENLVARRLDALQTLLAFRWARMNQVASIGVAALVLFYALAPIRADSEFVAVVLSFAGGLLAPLSKDVIAIIGDVRR